MFVNGRGLKSNKNKIENTVTHFFLEPGLNSFLRCALDEPQVLWTSRSISKSAHYKLGPLQTVMFL